MNQALLSFSSMGGTCVEVLRGLLKAGADIHVQDPKDRIPLRYTEAEFTEALVKGVFNPKMKIEKRHILRATPLHYAAADGEEEVVQVLLDAGAYKEAKNAGGQTPLHVAVQKGYEKIVKLFLKAELDIEAKDRQGKTPCTMP